MGEEGMEEAPSQTFAALEGDLGEDGRGGGESQEGREGERGGERW